MTAIAVPFLTSNYYGSSVTDIHTFSDRDINKKIWRKCTPVKLDGQCTCTSGTRHRGLPSRSSTAAAAILDTCFRTLAAFSDRGIHSEDTDALIEDNIISTGCAPCVSRPRRCKRYLTPQIASRNTVSARNGNPNSAAYARAIKYSMLPPMFQYMTSVDGQIIPKNPRIISKHG
jgi:hypothetical protein